MNNIDKFKKFDDLRVKTSEECWDLIQKNMKNIEETYPELECSEAFHIMGGILARLGYMLSKDLYENRVEKEKTEYEFNEIIASMIMKLNLKLYKSTVNQ